MKHLNKFSLDGVPMAFRLDDNEEVEPQGSSVPHRCIDVVLAVGANYPLLELHSKVGEALGAANARQYLDDPLLELRSGQVSGGKPLQKS